MKKTGRYLQKIRHVSEVTEVVDECMHCGYHYPFYCVMYHIGRPTVLCGSCLTKLLKEERL